jgi:Amt family ammonium transporter
MLTAGVIVFFMQSGFALLESGTVRYKNYQNILLKNCMDACIGGLVWWCFGFGIAYGDVDGGFIGTKYFFGVGMEEDGKYADWFFQYCFACTAATIVSGSLAERVNINAYLLFSFFITGFIYPVVVAWTWGEGWLLAEGFTDFAGSGVVHLTGGIAGLCGAIIAGPRIGIFEDEDEAELDPENPVRPLKTIMINNVNGYDEVFAKYERGEWDILRVHEFVRTYQLKMSERKTAS